MTTIRRFDYTYDYKRTVLTPSATTRPTTIRLPDDIKNRVTDLAAKEGVSFARMLICLIAVGLTTKPTAAVPSVTAQREIQGRDLSYKPLL